MRVIARSLVIPGSESKSIYLPMYAGDKNTPQNTQLMLPFTDSKGLNSPSEGHKA